MMNRISSRKTYIYTNQAAVFTPTEVLLYFSLILNLIYSLSYPAYTVLHSCYHLIIFGVTVLLFVCEFKIRVNLLKAFGLALFLLMSITAILINNSGLGLIILIVWPLVIIYVFKNHSFSANYMDRINSLMLIGWLFAAVTTLKYNAQFFKNFEGQLEFEEINPNTIAIIITFTSLFLALYIDHTSKSKFLKTIVYVISLAALYRTSARASFIAYLAVLLLGVFGKNLIKRSKKTAILITAAIVTVGIAFPFVYTLLFSKGIISYHTLFLGKRVFTGRQYIWLNLWEYLQTHKDAYIWGVGYTTELYSKGTFNMHNAFIMIFAQYGIPIFLIYLWFIFRVVHRLYHNKKCISDVQFKCFQILIYVLIVGFGETILTYLPNLIFIAMAIGIGSREQPGGLTL